MIATLTGCKNFVSKRKRFIFNAFVDFKPVERGVICEDLQRIDRACEVSLRKVQQ